MILIKHASLSLRAAIALALLIGATSTYAQNALDRHVGPISNFVELGTSGAWTSAADNNWFTLANNGAIGEIQYYWATQPDFEGRDFAVSTNLFTQPTNGDLSHAGFIFHIRDQQRYLAVTIASDGGAYVFSRSPEGLDVTPLQAEPARLNGSDVLELSVSGNVATARLNGDVLFDAEIGGNGPTRTIGVFAAGSGVAGFTNMAIR